MNKPQRLKSKIATHLAVLASLLVASSAPAAVLLTDTFTLPPGGVNNQDVNQGIAQGSRQTGPLASASSGFFSTYTFSSSQHQIGNTTTDVGQPVVSDGGYILLAGGSFQSDLDIAKVSTGPLTIQVDMYNNGADGGSADQTEWMGFTLRSPGNTFPIAGTGEFGLLKRANGGFEVFQNGGEITGDAYSGAGFTADGTFVFTFTDTAGTGSAFIGNGSKVTILNVPTGFSVTLTLSQLSSTGLRLGFSNDQRFGGIDNLIISGTLPAAPALSVLFHDNFNAFYGLSTENNNNMNVDLVDRQSGLLAPFNYTPGDWHHQLANTGTDVGQPFAGADGGYVLTAFNGNFYSDLDIPVISTGPLKIEADMYAKNGWLAFGLRHVPSKFAPDQGGAGEFGMLRQPDGGLQLWDGSGSITPSGWNNAGFTPSAHLTFLFTDTAGTGSAFTGNGSKVTLLSGGTTLGTVTLTQLSSSGLKLGFRADGGTLGGVDNLTVSGTVPAVIAPNLVTDIHPLRSKVTTGQSWTLSVGVTGTPLYYQWYNQSGPISGAKTNSYTFNAVAGTSTYYCIVTNTSGSVTSSVASVFSAADIVTVNNFSFENGYTVAFGNGGDPVQWTRYNNNNWCGVSASTSQFSPAVVPDGTQYYAVNRGPSDSGVGGAYQDVGPLQPNTTYTLTVAIGRGDDKGVDPNGLGDWSPGIISLLNGTDNTGTVLASTTGYPTTPGTWQDYTATFTTGPSVSGDLVIQLGVDPADTWQSLFDNVRLTVGAPTAVLTQTILPAQAETFVGDQIVFSAAYADDTPSTLQWVHIGSGPVTNLVNTGVVNVDNAGVTTSTLTLSSVQLTDAGSYVLEAINATNSAAIAYSPAAQLVVSTPVAAGNIIQKNSAQTAVYPYYPGWTINNAADLIYNFGSSGVGPGNFTLEAGLASDAAVLTDGILGDDFPNMVSCGWVNASAGQSITYTLPATANGYELTNITVYGGWSNDGRNELKFQVLYSTAAAPATFVSIGTFDYNPGFNNSAPNANRSILIPVSGALAHNVANVQINFNMQSKNNWNGYSEITIGGTPSLGVLPVLTQDITPNTAEDVVGGQLILTGAFTGATSYQWQKDGVNLVGQTTNTLILNNLQLADTATNGGYRLLGINVAGANATRGCAVVVDAAPVAVGNVVTAVAYQTSDSTVSGLFTPTWSTNQLGASLIIGQSPSDSLGDFVKSGADNAGGLPVLTDGNYGYFFFDTTHPAFACGGPNAGETVTYTLGSNPNGYNVTNIQIAGGWNDNGRDSQYYTVSYSTVANPTMFSALATMQKNLYTPGYGVNDATAVRTTFTPAVGVLASNVYAIQVDFTYPVGVPNDYSGYSEVSVLGSASATPPPAGPVITTQHEETTFDYVLETPNLIAGQLPSATGPAGYTGANSEGCTEAGFTDGVLSFGGNANSGMGGSDTNNSYSWIVFSSTNTGWNLTSIVTYSLWHDYGRDGQFYNVSYSTLAAPNTWVPLASVAYNPYVPHSGTASANRVQISPATGQTLLAADVYAVKFDFTPQGSQDYSWSGYTEIVLQGSDLAAPTAPVVSSPHISGGNLILTGTGGTPNYVYDVMTTTNLVNPTWKVIATGVSDATGYITNAIPINATNPASFFRVRVP